MKRAKQLQVVVDYFNKYAEANFIDDAHDMTFIVITNALIHAGQYRGYVYKFRDGSLGVEGDCDYICIL